MPSKTQTHPWNTAEVYERITAILEDEDDWVTAMATVACELHNSFEHYHWTWILIEQYLLKS